MDTMTFPLRLSNAQRRAIAELFPHLEPRLQLDATNARTLQFGLQEVKWIARACRVAVHTAETSREGDSLLHVVDAAERVLSRLPKGEIHRIPPSQRLYQFKITLTGIGPPIWRRIQTEDCTLDKLHEHIQTAMGWSNYHLHRFEIDGVVYGDLELLYEAWEDATPPVNSLRIWLSTLVPEDGKPFQFQYEYDFGDRWRHEVVFEGCLRAEKRVRYPLCVEGERACPPEDVGGIHGYREYLETLRDPDHEEWDETSDWRGPYRPEHFDAVAATKTMQRGLPNWRQTQ